MQTGQKLDLPSQLSVQERERERENESETTQVKREDKSESTKLKYQEDRKDWSVMQHDTLYPQLQLSMLHNYFNTFSNIVRQVKTHKHNNLADTPSIEQITFEYKQLKKIFYHHNDRQYHN